MKNTKLLLLPILLLSIGSCGSNNPTDEENSNSISSSEVVTSNTYSSSEEDKEELSSESIAEEKTNITVTLVKNNNEENEQIEVDLSTSQSLESVITANPYKDYFNFEGWYTDEALTNKADLTSLPNNDITLYANYLSPIDYYESISVGTNITIWGYVRSIGTVTISSQTVYYIIVEGLQTGEMYFLYKNETYLNSILHSLKCCKSFIKVEGSKKFENGSYAYNQFYYIKPRLITDLSNEENLPEMPGFQSFEDAQNQELTYSLFEDTFTLRAFNKEEDDEDAFIIANNNSALAQNREDYMSYTKLESKDGKIYYALYPYKGIWTYNNINGESFSSSNPLDKEYKVTGYINHKTGIIFYTFFTPVNTD